MRGDIMLTSFIIVFAVAIYCVLRLCKMAKDD